MSKVLAVCELYGSEIVRRNGRHVRTRPHQLRLNRHSIFTLLFNKIILLLRTVTAMWSWCPGENKLQDAFIKKSVRLFVVVVLFHITKRNYVVNISWKNRIIKKYYKLGGKRNKRRYLVLAFVYLWIKSQAATFFCLNILAPLLNQSLMNHLWAKCQLCFFSFIIVVNSL